MKKRSTSYTVQKNASVKASRQQVRIIGGMWKRTLLAVPDLDGLRPTPDRVRETLFNWLGPSLAGQCCLDLFAGSGALGFEAASRGAARVLMIEQQYQAVQQLQAVQTRLGAHAVEIIKADALQLAAKLAPASFDLILLDPPFKGSLLARALTLCLPLVAAGGALYLEAALPLVRLAENRPEDVASRDGALFPDLRCWEMTRAARAGAVHYHLLRHKPEL